MNEYLTSPVTPIVIVAVAVAGTIALVTTVLARRRTRQAEAEVERLRMEARVDRQLADELRAKKKPEPRRVSVPRSARTGRYTSSGRTSAPTPSRSNNTDVDHMGLFIPMAYSDPAPSRDDRSPSSYDSPSPSSGSDSGSSSSSSDSGSSPSGGCD